MFWAMPLDGNGWSGRYQSLLASGSVVLKATVFPEWISDWLIPYYHFIVRRLRHPGDPLIAHSRLVSANST